MKTDNEKYIREYKKMEEEWLPVKKIIESGLKDLEEEKRDIILQMTKETFMMGYMAGNMSKHLEIYNN